MKGSVKLGYLILITVGITVIASCGGGSSKCNSGDLGCNPGQTVVPSGSAGVPGPSGSTGVPGPSGSTGVPGPSGSTGVPGPGGSTGVSGGGSTGVPGGGSGSNIQLINATPVNGYLDCELDPNKIYMIGYFAQGLADQQAIVDPTNPDNFCIGFPESSMETGFISPSGQYIYEWANSIFGQVEESLQRRVDDPDQQWVYPEDAQLNDEQLVSDASYSPRDRPIFQDPTSGTVYYQSLVDPSDRDEPLSVFRSDLPGQPYYSRQDDVELVAVLADGAFLVIDDATDLLIHVDSNLVETALIAPTANRFDIPAARLFIEQGTGNQSVWLLASVLENSERVKYRWTFDTITLQIIDEGIFADPPADMNNIIVHSTLDTNGDLWEILFYGQINARDGAVIKRPILSSGAPSEFIYNNSDYTGGNDWRIEPQPFVRVGLHLITGS